MIGSVGQRTERPTIIFTSFGVVEARGEAGETTIL